MATNPPAIARVQTTDRNINQLQSNILTPLNKLLQNKIVNNNFLTQVPLVNGTNTINHLLGRQLIGWSIIRKRAAADIYDHQDSNPNPDVTLVLVSNAAVTVDLMVF